MTRPARLIPLALACALLSLAAFAGGDDRPTIGPSDIPKDAPRFEDYPATPYSGAQAAPDVRSEPRSRMYRTQLIGWAREKPNFAGHYVLATWGCGTGCTQIAIIDSVTGKVFHPPGVRTNSIVDVDPELLVDTEPDRRRADFGALQYRADSRLLILAGTPENREDQRGISYFVWNDGRLARIRFVATPSAATR
jgi:hypothetical protein